MSDRADAAQAVAEGAAAQTTQEADETRGGAAAPADADEGATGAGSGQHEHDDGGRTADPATRAARREAASYRTRLRETEAERDTLRARIDRADRADAERIAAESMTDPADLWLTAQLDGMRGEDGELDAERVSAEVARVLRDRPHWRKGHGVNFAGGARGPAPTDGGGFGAAIKRAVTGER